MGVMRESRRWDVVEDATARESDRFEDVEIKNLAFVAHLASTTD